MVSFILSQCLLRGLKNKCQPQLEIRRFRWWKEQKSKPLIRRWGYDPDMHDIAPPGLLPRLKDALPYKQIPIYKPKDPWTPEKAMQGQNDYIDILGDGRIKPHQISYNVPSWLRGFAGNELQRLIHKMKRFEGGSWQNEHPTKYKKTKQRIEYLWYRLNYRRRIESPKNRFYK